MRVIPKYSNWIYVDSAFGGFGIYKASLFRCSDYGNPMDDSLHGSEHVELHRQMRDCGANLYINPSLINAGWNTYNLNRYFVVRQSREFLRSHPNLSVIIRKLSRLSEIKLKSH